MIYPRNRLWSLWEMLRPYASNFLSLAKIIYELERLLVALAENQKGVSDKQIEALSKAVIAQLPAFKSVSEFVPIPSIMAQVERIKGTVSGKYVALDLYRELQELRTRMEDELSAHQFYYVRAEHLELYNGNQLFGEEVDNHFPSAIDDIMDSGRCLALDMGTASVFHSMRVMELGLKSLSNVLRIPYAPSWESHIKQIDSKITAKHRTKGVQWKRDESFFRDVLGDLTAVKIAWRNPTMHIVKRYSPEEAENVFRAVRTFMIRLASRYDEKGKKVFSQAKRP